MKFDLHPAILGRTPDKPGPLNINADLIFFFFSLIVIILSGVAVLSGSPFLLFLLLLLILGLIGICILNPRIVLTVALLMSSLSGALSVVSIEGLAYSANGLLNGLVLLISSIVLIAHSQKIRRSWIINILPFIIFTLWLLFRVLGSPSLVIATKDAGLVVAPLLVYLIVRLIINKNTERTGQIERLLVMYSVIPIIIVITSMLIGILSNSEQEFVSPIGQRTMALFFIIILGISLSRWRFGTTHIEHTTGFFWSIFVALLIIASLSRTATVIAAVLFSITFLRPRRIYQWVLVGGLGILFFVLLFQIPQFRARFFFTGGNISDIFNMQSLDTQGRNNLWPLVWKDALSSPVFGKGTGSSRILVNSTYSNLEHPHNDYLRVFHDTGVIGLFLFILAWGFRMYRQWRLWVRTRNTQREVAKYQMAAFLTCIGIMISFVTDNTLVYTFVTIPAFIIIALADSAFQIERESSAHRISNGNHSLI